MEGGGGSDLYDYPGMAMEEDYPEYEKIDSEDEPQIHMTDEEETMAPKSVTEVLAEAISNETTDVGPVGFAAKFATTENDKAINQEIADCVKYLKGISYKIFFKEKIKILS